MFAWQLLATWFDDYWPGCVICVLCFYGANFLWSTGWLSAEDAEVPGQLCVYGKCHYCKDSEAVCANDDNLLEGVVLQLIPGSFSKYRSPWQRTYKDLVKAEWETNMDFCQ